VIFLFLFSLTNLYLDTIVYGFVDYQLSDYKIYKNSMLVKYMKIRGA